MTLALSPSDRVLFVTPHPDDESLAAGGLIQHVEQSGAQGRVLMITNGDNNPWPQRWMEKRWRIGVTERARWGAMRQGEAQAALDALGFTGETRFLGFPDQGTTAELLCNDSKLMEALCANLAEWCPTFLVFPSTHDLHPDHNALHVLMQIALKRLGMDALPQLHFAVHCHHREYIPNPFSLELSEPERQRKYDAIACHKSQMLLSSKRFLAYARPEEGFFQPAPAQAVEEHHPVRRALLEPDRLRLSVTLPRYFRGVLWIVGERASGESFRWELPMPIISGKVPVTDLLTGQRIAEAKTRVDGPLMRFRIALPAKELSLLYVKYHRPTIFLDSSGWRQVPLEVTTPPEAE